MTESDRISPQTLTETIAEAWDFSDPKASKERFESLLQRVDDLASKLEVETQIARALGLQRNFEEGHARLDAVESRRSEGAERADVRYLLERGRLFNSSGRKDGRSGAAIVGAV